MQARLRTALLCTATFVAAPVAWSPAAPAAGAVDEIVTNTGIAGSPVEVEAAPSGFGVITGTGAAGEPTVTLRGPNGAATDLGEANAPAFFLGTAADPLLVSTRDERTGQDLNGDGDEVDTVLVTSDGTSPFASVAGGPVTVDTASPFVDCLRRISATLAVACFSEGASDTDLNSDTDFGDLELVLVDDTGTIDLTGQFIADINTVGDIDGLTLPDGSVAIGPARVMPNGAITIVTSVTDAQITALLGTNLVVTSRSSGATYVVPSVGAPMAVGTGGWLAFQVGSAVWVNNPISPGLCRLNADASTSCLGIAATWSVTQINNPDPTLIPLGDDAAVVFGRAPGDDPKETRVYRVLPGQPPQYLGFLADDAVALSDGSAWTGGRRITATTVQTFADGIPPRPLADGMALVDRDETTPGFDWSGDGDRNDRVTSLLTGTTLRNLGVNALAGISLGDGTLLLAVDEADGGDRNGDGDVADLVAAVFDGSSMIDLDLAVGQSGTNPATVGFARLGPGAGLLGVSEAAQGSDLDNDGSATHTVTFALTTHGTTSPPQFRSVTPTRVLDTRPDGPQTGYSGPRPTAGQTIAVTVPSGARSVTLNVTGLNATETGFVTVYPCGEPRPATSSLNLTPGVITPNLVISKVGADGTVCIFTQRSADLVADLAGTTTAMSPYQPLSPTRLLDTRPESPVNYSAAQGKPWTGWSMSLPLYVLPGASAVVLNVTGTEADAEGFVTVHPCADGLPTASNLNLTPGTTSANTVIVRVDTAGNGPNVCLFTQRPTHLVVDLVGMIVTDPTFTPVTPQRLIDTRSESQIGYSGPKPVAGQVVEVTASPGATALAMNITGLDSAETGFVTAYPCGEPWPLASNLNLTPGRITPNTAVVKVGANGKVCIFTQRSAHLVVDLAGVFRG